jgi:hypothetical protein
MGLQPTNRDENPGGARFSVPLSASAGTYQINAPAGQFGDGIVFSLDAGLP